MLGTRGLELNHLPLPRNIDPLLKTLAVFQPLSQIPRVSPYTFTTEVITLVFIVAAWAFGFLLGNALPMSYPGI